MSDKEHKRIFQIDLTRPEEMILKLEQVETLLRDLPGKQDWQDRYPEAPGHEQIRGKLEAERQAVRDELTKASGEASAFQRREIYTEKRPPMRRRSGSLIKRLFTDGPCPPTEPESEILYVPPSMIGNERSSEPDGSSWGFSMLRLPDQGTWNFCFGVADPNNDPFNSDFAYGSMYAWLRYDLPIRPYWAKYDIDIYGGIDFTSSSRSNHIFNTHWWRGWINGGLGFENEVYRMPDPFLPIYETKSWSPDGWNFRHDSLLQRSIVLEPNQSMLVELAYILFICIDRGVATASGYYWAGAPGLTGSLPPDLRCIITPI